ncbi:hypothetical protein MCC02038_08720 [Bifidobacteriaceae bacterium MCC02038]|nr:hypothetical protein MCC02038_08720 [Bifidobacteriaceae bacterium MCC02038]
MFYGNSFVAYTARKFVSIANTYCYCSIDSRIARLAEPEVRHCPSASRGYSTGIMETARREKNSAYGEECTEY